MSGNKRVERLINELYSGNKRFFSTAIEVSPTVIENIVGKRQGKPSFDVLCKISANANIDAEWLLTGKGEMIKGSTPKEDHAPKEQPPTDVLMAHIKEKDAIIRQQAEEIGRLKQIITHIQAASPQSTTTPKHSAPNNTPPHS